MYNIKLFYHKYNNLTMATENPSENNNLRELYENLIVIGKLSNEYIYCVAPN